MSQYQVFTLDQSSAKQADAGGRIEHTGKYVGTIKSMEFITTKKGTQGFEIHFETDEKESAIISVYTSKGDGTQLSGRHKINALLACAGVRTLTPQDQTLEKYDFETKTKIKQTCVVAPEMTGKRVGLLLQRENYLNSNNQPRHQMQLFACFNAQSELMAKEILDRKTQPESLPKSLERLLSFGDATRASQSNSSQGSYGAQQGGGYGRPNQPQHQGYGQAPTDLDDSLPF